MPVKNYPAHRFHARNVTTLLENDDTPPFLLVGFSEQTDGQGEYLVMQFDLEVSEEAEKAGQDDIYVEWKDEKHHVYGGLSRVTLDSGQIILDLDPRGQKALGLSQLTVSFQIAEKDWVLLKDFLIEMVFDPCEMVVRS